MFPAPMSAIFLRAISGSSSGPFPSVFAGKTPTLNRGSGGELQTRDDPISEAGTGHLFRAIHQTSEVVGDGLLRDRLFQAVDDAVRSAGPAEVLEHHHARQDHRPG